MMAVQAAMVLEGGAKGGFLKRLLSFMGPAFIASVGYALFLAMMELVAMATDLDEFICAAVGLQLLFGLPLWIGGIVTAIATFLLLGFERYGFRPLEAIITTFVAAVPRGGREAAERIAASLDPGRVETIVLRGRPARAILSTARPDDMIILATHRRLGLDASLDGCVAFGIARSWQGSMLIVPVRREQDTRGVQ